jgi:LPXTG-motif cell wall-anchored protein
MYGGLPNTGLNISTPFYALIALIGLIIGGINLLRERSKQ